jgi:hypothetical protein
MSSRKSSADNIICPKCGEEIALTETLREQIGEEARAEIQEQINTKERSLASREKQLRSKETELKQAQESIEAQVDKRLAEKETKLKKDAIAKGRQESSQEIEALQMESADKTLKLQEAQRNELVLRKEKRQLEEAREALELDVKRKVDAEREQIREHALAQAEEQHRLKDAEKDKKLADAVRMNEELSRKLQQGSQQIQGEVLELEIEALLRDCCPWDEILPVPKGVRGADVLHVVRSRSGLRCGKLIWEAKHTKTWNVGWISKLKDDQQEANADIAVIVTDVLPEEIAHFGIMDGVWITGSRYVRELIVILRAGIEEVAHTKRSIAGKNETIETIYNYLTGSEFANRVEAVVRAFVDMKECLDREKRNTINRWAEREKQLDRALTNMSGMYGDLQGLTGRALRKIAPLEDGESEPQEGTRLSLAASWDE